MNCGMSMVKYILFIFNLLCALCGVLIIVLGGLLFSDIHNIGEFPEKSVAQAVPLALVVLGALIFIIAFFGCCGAIRESECMSMTYATLLFVLLVLDIALVALVFTTQKDQKNIANNVVDAIWKNLRNNPEPMNFIQKEWKCCGVNGPTDYNLVNWTNFPQSCCDENIFGCTILTAHKTGCRQAAETFVKKHADIIAYTGLGIMAVELIGFIFACCLANHIRNHRRRSTY